MTIDIYFYTKDKSVEKDDFVGIIDSVDFQNLTDIFEKFQKRTGYRFDEYGDLILSVGALENLFKLIIENEKINHDEKIKKSIKKLKEFIQNAIKSNQQLAFYGD